MNKSAATWRKLSSNTSVKCVGATTSRKIRARQAPQARPNGDKLQQSLSVAEAGDLAQRKSRANVREKYNTNSPCELFLLLVPRKIVRCAERRKKSIPRRSFRADGPQAACGDTQARQLQQMLYARMSLIWNHDETNARRSETGGLGAPPVGWGRRDNGLQLRRID